MVMILGNVNLNFCGNNGRKEIYVRGTPRHELRDMNYLMIIGLNKAI